MRINKKALSLIICFIVIATSINAKGCNDKAAVIVGNSSASTNIIFTPYNLTAIIASPTQINILWIDNSDNETGFRLERSVNGNRGYGLLATVAANINAYTDNDAKPETNYYYRIRGFNEFQYSAYSAEINCNIAIPNSQSYLGSPTYLTYRIMPPPMLMPPQNGGDTPPDIPATLTVSWIDNSDNESGFVLEYQLPGSTQWQTYSTVEPNVTSYSSFVDERTDFYLRVRAFNGTDYGLPSGTIEIVISTSGNPTAPSSLRIQNVNVIRDSDNNTTEIWLTLAWNDNSNNETGFVIEFGAGNEWNQLLSVASNITTATFNVITDPGRDYRIRAFNRNGNSTPSDILYIWGPSLLRWPR